MVERYFQKHWSQYYPGASAITRSSGCTWTSAANGTAAQSGGKKVPTPDQVHSLVARSEETAPATPGWALPDVDKAMARLGVPFTNRSGAGWAALKIARAKGLGILLQGDSDQFPNTSCSGDFNGDHAIYIHPDNSALGNWRIDDPICGSARYEHEDTLRHYAQKLSTLVRFGTFDVPVPFPKLAEVIVPGLRFDNFGPVIGVVEMIDDWPIWRVRDNSRTAKIPKGTKFDLRGVVKYHPDADNPVGYKDGWIGALVDYQGEAHIVPRDRVSKIRLVGDVPN